MPTRKRYLGLSDLDDRLTDLIPIADSDVVIGESLHGEVLAKLPVSEVVAVQLSLPVAIGLDLVHEHGSVLPAARDAVSARVRGDRRVLPADHREIAWQAPTQD
jgi:hypothetical protein